MAETLRQKFQAKFRGFGASPPSWTNRGDDGRGLGRADNDPTYIASGLGFAGYVSTGEDWLDDIYQILRIAFRSRVLYGLYGEPIKKGNNTIQFMMAPDVQQAYAPSRRMILSTLWAAEQLGLIAMPQKLKVSTSGNVVTISW